jgi:signal transduction histidine kinase
MPDRGLSQRVTERMLKGLLRALAEQPAQGLEENCRAIEKQTESFARAHASLFADLGSVTVPEEAKIEEAPNGSLYQSNLKGGSSLFVPRSSVALMGEEQWEFARKSVQLNDLYRQVVENTPNVVAAYINTNEPVDMNRYYPFIDRTWDVYPADLDMKDFNFFYEADAEHNPGRKTVWTGIYADPAGRGWMLSCIAPVYVGDVLKGVVGLDVTLGEMLDSIVKLSLPGGASSLLVAPSGAILARTDRVRRLLGLGELQPFEYTGPIASPETDPEVLRLDSVADEALRQDLLAFLGSDDSLREIPSPEGPLLVAQALVPATGWKFWLVVRRSDLLEEVDELAGLESRLQSELHARERELAYINGLYESAAAHLHDIGNAVTILESSLMDLNKLVKSSEQYPEAFRLIRAGGETGEATLRRFEEVLTGKNVPALKAIADSITRLKQRINDALSRDLAAFKAATKLQKVSKFQTDGLRMSEEIDLPQLLEEVCAAFRRSHAAVEWSAAAPITVRSHRAMLKGGLDNIIRNAVQASPPGGTVRVDCAQTADGVTVTVTDQGRGIAAADLRHVGEPGFTTKPDGHGLGLHYFRKHLELSGGKLEFFSAGRGHGARVTATINHA